MVIKRIILSIIFIFASINLVAVEQPLTLEQRLLMILQKYHIGENQWILNGIIAALPIYCVIKNAQEFIALLDHNFGIMEVICPSCPKDFLAAPALESSLPVASAGEQITAPMPEIQTNIQEPYVTSFHFGMMSAFLILISAARGICSGQ